MSAIFKHKESEVFRGKICSLYPQKLTTRRELRSNKNQNGSASNIEAEISSYWKWTKLLGLVNLMYLKAKKKQKSDKSLQV